MIIVLHVIIALMSIVSSTAAYIVPSKPKLNVTYGLILLTLASGSYLVWSTHSSLLSSCITGLIYLGIVMSGVLAARNKLVQQEIYRDKNKR